ncbi:MULTISPECIES: hypothetical protein [Bacillus subtilis group]|uniref:hypothetical protein n=1 Tax=Bacillus subtilis group TaxID=653685 RepID=UPI0002E051E6|nr:MULTISPECIES: hypothetical protein [Bacillus subtilis group]AUG35958.1 hypothetical protein CXP43_09560 [Bacillus velezensis]KUP30310.1 hypothetical protein AU385_18020 [Bacillus halotolerans]MCK6102256.1 hypothetical protein [Bacillus velezensis]MCK6203305.1 hypothetical protein [Bacillus velezensis]MCY8466929.1 hypothetical protein [Bacillus atrophaeus]
MNRLNGLITDKYGDAMYRSGFCITIEENSNSNMITADFTLNKSHLPFLKDIVKDLEEGTE